MIRWIAAGGAALLALVAAYSLISNRHPTPLPPAPPRAAAPIQAAAVPLLPAAQEGRSPVDREARRLNRYDKDKDGSVSRDEYLAARRKAYAKLDTDGDGKLSFDEYAVKTIAKFTDADTDKSAGLSPAEFATTAVKRKPKAPCPVSAEADS